MAANVEAEAQRMAQAQVEAPALPRTWERFKQTKTFKELVRDIWDDNPTFRMVLAMCPTMGVTNMAINGFTMGVATMIATALSSFTVSLVRNLVPNEVRIAVYMIIIAAWVTVIAIIMQVTMPDLYKLMATFVGLIVTNCFVLGRAEAFASKNGPWLSFVDAMGVGLGFTASLTLLGIVRDLLGFGGIHYNPFNLEAIIPLMPQGLGTILGGAVFAFLAYFAARKFWKLEGFNAMLVSLTGALVGAVAGTFAVSGLINVLGWTPTWTPWVIMIVPGGAFLTVGLYVGIVKHFSPGGVLGGAS